jgi:hypothetical protein
METSTRIIDYDLKYCIEGGFSKITTSGRNIPSWFPWLPKKQAARPATD